MRALAIGGGREMWEKRADSIQVEGMRTIGRSNYTWNPYIVGKHISRAWLCIEHLDLC